MNTKLKQASTLFALVVMMVTLYTPVSAASVSEDRQTEKFPEVIVTIAERPTKEDQDWPIIKVETGKTTDPITGQMITWTMTTRRSPVKKTCVTTNSLLANTTCYYVDSQSRSSVSSPVGGIIVHVTHYADHYCTDDCTWNLYKPTRLDVWWTRPDSTVTLQRADTKWGCTGVCQLCDGGQFIYYYDSGYFTPTWLNNTQSYAYIYTTTPQGPFPPLYSTMIYLVSGSNNAEVYRGSTDLGNVGTFAGYPS